MHFFSEQVPYTYDGQRHPLSQSWIFVGPLWVWRLSAFWYRAPWGFTQEWLAAERLSNGWWRLGDRRWWDENWDFLLKKVTKDTVNFIMMCCFSCQLLLVKAWCGHHAWPPPSCPPMVKPWCLLLPTSVESSAPPGWAGRAEKWSGREKGTAAKVWILRFFIDAFFWCWKISG